MKITQKTARNDQMDNIRGLLIFAVVFGHMLELFMGKSGMDRAVYLIIYSFHMPLFAFVSGVFARFDPVRIRNRMIYPYLVFQTLYILYANHVLEAEEKLQYTTPYWILWYLFATVAWNLVLPLIETQSAKKKLIWLGLALVGAMYIGFDNKAGYYLSFSRIVEFFPFFLAGHYSRSLKEEVRRHIGQLQRHRLKIVLIVSCVLFLLFAVGIISGNEDDIRSIWFYGSASYQNAKYGWRLRILCLAVAAGWTLFFLLVIPTKRLPVLSRIGANTMTVYLLHGFVLRFLKVKKLFKMVQHPLLCALLLTIVLLLVLSLGPVQRLMAPLTSLEAARQLKDRLTARLRLLRN